MSTLTIGHTWDDLVEAILTHDLAAQRADWHPEPADPDTDPEPTR